MKFLKVNLNKILPADIKYIADSLNKGEVVVLPTDTIYGLSCLASCEKAIKRIKLLKGNDSKKPLSVLVSDIKMLKKYVLLSKGQEERLQNIWLKKLRPTTVILKHRLKLPKALTGKSDGLAARLPKLDFLIKILEEVKQPIVSTSLNLTGREAINNPKDISKFFPLKGKQPDLVVDAGVCRRSKASAILDLRGNLNPEVIRK